MVCIMPRWTLFTIGVACSSLYVGSNAFVSPTGARDCLGPSPPRHSTANAVSSSRRATPSVAVGQPRGQQQHHPSLRERNCRPLLSSASPDDDDDDSEEKAPDDVDAILVENEDGDGKEDGDGDGGVDVGKAEIGVGNPVARSKLKSELIRKVATLNRGFVAREEDRVDIEEIVEMLELENPNPKPCKGFESEASPISGRWRLLYTTSLDVLSLQVNPTVTIGQIFQHIEADGQKIQNIIELQPPFAAVSNRILGSSLATLTVKLEAEPVSDSRIDLKFVRTEIKANSVFGRELDLPSLGVDIPSGEKLQQILERGKKRVEKAKKKAQTMGKKCKQKGDTATSTEDTTDSSGDEVKDDAEVSDAMGDDGDKKSSTTDAASSSISKIMKPYFETTYVDDELRIGRTGSGDLYVSARA